MCVKSYGKINGIRRQDTSILKNLFNGEFKKGPQNAKTKTHQHSRKINKKCKIHGREGRTGLQRMSADPQR